MEQTKRKLTYRTIYVLSAILGIILLVVIFFVIQGKKMPYEDYDDNVYLYYKTVYINGEYHYVIDANPIAVKGAEYPEDRINIWREEQRFYFEVFAEKSLSMEYELAFIANLYDYNGNIFIRLNEVDTKIPNLTIKD